ncbi:MAG: hypothetical protein AAFY64_08995, partial [Pseudomonadota bacterium]
MPDGKRRARSMPQTIGQKPLGFSATGLSANIVALPKRPTTEPRSERSESRANTGASASEPDLERRNSPAVDLREHAIMRAVRDGFDLPKSVDDGTIREAVREIRRATSSESAYRSALGSDLALILLIRDPYFDETIEDLVELIYEPR